MKPRLAIISSSNYDDYPTGGMMNFIVSILPHLMESFEVELFGVDSSKTKIDSVVLNTQGITYRKFAQVNTGTRKIVPNVLKVAFYSFFFKHTLRKMNFDYVYIHGVPINSISLKSASYKLVHHIHGITNPFMFNGLPRFLSSIIAPVYEMYRKKVIDHSDYIFVAADEQGLREFKENYPNSSEKIFKIENFAHDDFNNIKVSKKSNRVAWVSRASVQKDPLFAIRSWAQFKIKDSENFILDFVGDGDLMQDCLALAEELNVSDSIDFHYEKDRSFIIQCLKDARLYLYTSHSNGFPISLIEAANAGCAIVTSDAKGVYDVVQPNVNGIIVRERWPEHFANAMVKALAEDYACESKAIGQKYSAANTALTISKILQVSE